jgi:AcrR family transcriptional regulator
MNQIVRSPDERRPYRSPTRERHAAETRARILGAARELLARNGYAGTTVEAIAATAEVSPKTVSAVVGSKRDLLAALVTPDAFAAPIQDLLGELRASPEPLRRLELVALVSRRVFESLTTEFELLRTAGGVAPELAELARQIETRRRHNQSGLIDHLRERGVLRQDRSPEEATDVLWSLTSYDVYHMLVLDRGWAPERYENWLAALLVEQLVRAVGA